MRYWKPSRAVSNGHRRRPASTTSVIPSEHDEQKLFVAWFEFMFPGIRIFAIPNGGDRHPAVAAKLKAEGVKKGVPDLFVPGWRLWIEMKRQKGGSVSADQKDWHVYLQAIGYVVLVCKGHGDAKAQVLDFKRGDHETIDQMEAAAER